MINVPDVPKGGVPNASAGRRSAQESVSLRRGYPLVRGGQGRSARSIVVSAAIVCGAVVLVLLVWGVRGG